MPSLHCLRLFRGHRETGKNASGTPGHAASQRQMSFDCRDVDRIDSAHLAGPYRYSLPFARVDDRLDFTCLTTFHANSRAFHSPSVGCFCVLTTQVARSKPGRSAVCAKYPPEMLFTTSGSDSVRHPERAGDFFFAFKIVKACSGKRRGRNRFDKTI